MAFVINYHRFRRSGHREILPERVVIGGGKGGKFSRVKSTGLLAGTGETGVGSEGGMKAVFNLSTETEYFYPFLSMMKYLGPLSNTWNGPS